MPIPSTDKFALEAETITLAAPKPPQESDPLGEPAAFSTALIDWFAAEGRDYPWRRTRDPYAVLVSEVMLQQTQIATVLSKRYFERWLEQFPDVETLAAASESEILKAWEGLGYYRRARNLQRAARTVIEDEAFQGEFPRKAEKIQQLPGVGRYTAGAVASFACGEAAPIVDGNIARVLARIFDYREAIDRSAGQRQLWAWAEALLPSAEHADVRAYNSALMELGQTHCAKAGPACHRCPVAAFCATSDPASLPRKKAGARIENITEHAALIVDSNGRVLLEQVPSGARREGMWQLPALNGDDLLGPELSRSRYGITRYRVDLIIHRSDEAELLDGAGSTPPADAPKRAWFDADALSRAAMPAPYRRALEPLLLP